MVNRFTFLKVSIFILAVSGVLAGQTVSSGAPATLSRSEAGVPVWNDGNDVVDDGNDQEESRPFDAAQLSRAKDDELLPGVGHLQRGGDDDRGDYNGDT